MKSRIIIVDDNIRFREGLKLLIEIEEIGEVVGEAENGKVFLDLLEKLNPDLVLMDIEMPIMGGLEATKIATKNRPDLKILVISMQNEKVNYCAIIKAGAMGYIQKTAGKQELESAIRTAISSKTVSKLSYSA